MILKSVINYLKEVYFRLVVVDMTRQVMYFTYFVLMEDIQKC